VAKALSYLLTNEYLDHMKKARGLYTRKLAVHRKMHFEVFEACTKNVVDNYQVNTREKNLNSKFRRIMT